MNQENEPVVSGIPLAIDDKPFMFWDWNLKERNLEFLRGIDAEYFIYVVQSNMEHLEGENKHHAALSIRLAYSQAIETLFALLAALVQAPQCPLGWLLSYRDELRTVVEKISKRQPLLTRLQPPTFTWHTLSERIHSPLACDNEKKQWIHQGFGDCWSKFTTDFLNQRFNDEYNSIKHGLRTRLGGFSLEIGDEAVPGTPAPRNKMKLVGKSEFGTSFFLREQIGQAKNNFRTRNYHRNWNPENILNAVGIAAMSINNTACFLRILNGETPEKCQFRHPNSPEVFKEPWAQKVTVIDANFDYLLDEQHITPQSKSEILASYQPQQAPGQTSE